MLLLPADAQHGPDKALLPARCYIVVIVVVGGALDKIQFDCQWLFDRCHLIDSCLS
jgi:hypothetical protein